MADNVLRQQRVLRQHVMTDQLLGVQQVSVAAQSPALVAAPTPAQVVSPEPVMSKSKGDKAEQLELLDVGQVRQCTKCVLCESRTQTVFGNGDPDAKLLFIGEGPGQKEDEQGIPFVGRSGELLNKMIVAMGLSREKVFIANIVKCRPPNNRTPLPDEVAECSAYLLQQIAIIQPKVIVTLGGPASKFILDTKKGITTFRGTWHSFDCPGVEQAIPVMPTFHPAYLLRQYTPDNRKKVWSDLQQVMAKLG
jgi:DNA polymerase